MSAISEQFKKAAAIIPKTSLILQEFLAVIGGGKPVCTMTLHNKSEKELIKSNFPELAILCKKIIFDGKQEVCAISRNKLLAEQTIKDLYNDNKKMGQLLGYPKCCIENHLKYCGQGKQFDSSLIAYRAYKSSKKCNFLVNNLLNFSTRVGHKYIKDFDRLGKLNRNSSIPLWYFQFISHIPCRYDCPESIKIGKEVDSLLKEYAPKVEKIVKYTLSKPILFFDLFKLVIFEGYLKEGTLYYQKIIPPFFLVDNSLMEKIESGNRITVDNKKIEILKNDSTLFIYQKKSEADGFILDFSED